MKEDKIAAFPTLNLLVEEMESFSTVKSYFLQHLENLSSKMKEYIPTEDFASLFWVNDPFNVNAINLQVPDEIKEEILEIQSDGLLKERFWKIGAASFWLSMKKEKEKTFYLTTRAILPFATTYLCEAGFSPLVDIKTKKRNRLEPEGDLRLALTNKLLCFEKNMEKVQAHASH